MIFPLLPMRFTGAVWYQGEANVYDATSYACRFPAMIADWRVQFGLPDLSFFYVSLAASHDSRFAYLRSAQDAALHLPRVGRALAIDLGDRLVAFHGFSPPIHVSAKGLGLRMDGEVTIALMVENNERNLQIPLDDKAGGWNVTLGWVVSGEVV